MLHTGRAALAAKRALARACIASRASIARATSSLEPLHPFPVHLALGEPLNVGVPVRPVGRQL